MDNLLVQLDKLVRDIVANPYFGLIGFIIGLAGLIFSYYVAKRDRRSKELHCALVSTNIVSKSETLFPKLSITYDDKNLESLTVTKIRIKNTGSEVVKINDIAQADPITFSARKNSDVLLLDFGISYVSDKLNNFELNKSDDNNKVSVKFDYIEPKDFIIVQILHTGKQNNDIEVTGTVIGAKNPLLRKEPKGNTQFQRAVFSRPRLSMLIILLVPILMCGVTSYVTYVLTENIFLGSLFLLPTIYLVSYAIRILLIKPDKDSVLLSKDRMLSRYRENLSMIDENSFGFNDEDQQKNA